MIKRLIIPALILNILTGCKKEQTHSYSIDNPVSVLTQHNDNTRAGLNNNETFLTTSNVNTAQFGKLFTLPVDDEVYAQPLVYGDQSLGFGKSTIVYIATVNNTVYAYNGLTGDLFWKKNYTLPGMRPPDSHDMASGWCNPYTNFTQNIGIVGTPAIDADSKTIYFVVRSTNGITFYQYLHAVSLIDGSEKSGSPVAIAASVAGTGDGNVNSIVSFDPWRNNQRQGLAIVDGVVYISWASHCDMNPYHGWIIGYDARTLLQLVVYNDTPSGENGGIWESGMGITADAQGSLYVTTGNGTVGQGGLYTSSSNGTNENSPNPNPSDITNRSESAIKLTPSGTTLAVSSFFTPSNYLDLNINDLDYGVSGTFLIPNSNLYFTGCKDGNIYILNKDDMGGYTSGSNNIVQTITINGNLHCQPAWYSGSSKEFAYIWSENDNLRAIPFNRSTNSFSGAQVLSDVQGPTGQSGAELSVSSNGKTDGTGIVWAAYAISTDAENIAGPGILRAFDANDITKQLWSSSQVPGDNPGYFAKFSAPTIANGHVYLATFSKEVVVYGLK
jgi:hypothetical protein